MAASIGAILIMGGEKKSEGKTEVVASFYPLAYMADYIGGEKVAVTSLIPENTEAHSWSPAASDILAAEKADIFLYNGAGLDAWVNSELLPAIDSSDTRVVKTTDSGDLTASQKEETRLFVYDNDNNQTLVYDVSDGEMALVDSYPFGLNAVASYSGFFDSAVEVTNSEGYVLLLIPNPTNLTILNTGIHGEHFHDPEIVTVIDLGKPVHYCVSPNGKYAAFALDGDDAAIVIDVDAPANYDIYNFAGSSTSSHATVVIDENNLLYFSDMREPQGDNLWVVDIVNGTEVLSLADGGNGPHGGFYSAVTKKVYINCADGIAVLTKDGLEEVIPYSHGGSRLSRSWINDNGTWLVSYVADTGLGLAYSKIVAYDLVNEVLRANITISVMSKAADGWPSSIKMQGDIVAISDPQNGSVILINVTSSIVKTLGLGVTAPQAIRLVEDSKTHTLWAVAEEGKVFHIDATAGELMDEYEMESGLGNNMVLSAVTLVSDEDEAIYDPHTWISPCMALKQGEAVYDALVAEDPENAAYFLERWNKLKGMLTDLDERYTDELADSPQDVVFVNHEAYGYLANRYGFEQEGIIGISADQQPSASALAALIEEMIEDEVYVVYLDPIFSDDYVNTLKENVESGSGHTVQIVRLYLMIGTIDDLDYLEQMEANLESLKIGLGVA